MPSLLTEKEALEALQDFLRRKPGARVEVHYNDHEFVLRVSLPPSIVDETAGALKIDRQILRDILAEEPFYEI